MIVYGIFRASWVGIPLPHPSLPHDDPRARAATNDLQELCRDEPAALEDLDRFLEAQQARFPDLTVERLRTVVAYYAFVTDGMKQAHAIYRISPIEIGTPWAMQHRGDTEAHTFLRAKGWLE